jgi:predicted MFS family arabinose efflux permease
MVCTMKQSLAAPQDDRSGRWSAGQWYILLLFTGIHLFLGVDRAIMAVLAEPVKRDFNLSDTQLGILIGIGFSAFYCIAGIFLGWAVDRWNRRWILSVCVGVFGAATASAALAGNFLQLLASRLVVGAGEAGGGPAMISIIADTIPPERRGFAMSIFYLGVPAGLLLNFVLGSYLAAAFGWRTAFIAAGLPAVALALITFLTLREPQRAKRTPVRQEAGRAALSTFTRSRSFWHILASSMLTSAALSAMISFAASFQIRSHGLTLQQAGLVLAAALGVGGLVSGLIGGAVADRLARRDIRWRAWFCGSALMLSWLGTMLALLAPSTTGAIAGFILWGFFANAVYGPQMATFQEVVPVRSRGLATAIFYLAGQLVGAGGGATLAGILSDALAPSYGADSLRYALLLMMLPMLWAAMHWLITARTLHEDTARAQH